MEKSKNDMKADRSSYDNAKALSMNGEQVTRTRDKYIKISKNDFKIGIITILAATIVSTNLISNLISAVNDRLASNEYIYQNRTIVTDNTHRTADRKHYWYDTDGIAYSIAESDVEDKTALLYSVYFNLSYDSLKHMDEIMKKLGKYDSEYKKYTDFEDYIIKLGFCKESGEADIEAYKKYMDKYICEVYRLEEMKSQIGGNDKQ